eukprot:31431-Pelagococcus_subviridis.AAC.10
MRERGDVSRVREHLEHRRVVVSDRQRRDVREHVEHDVPVDVSHVAPAAVLDVDDESQRARLLERVELRARGERVRSRARRAHLGFGGFAPGEVARRLRGGREGGDGVGGGTGGVSASARPREETIPGGFGDARGGTRTHRGRERDVADGRQRARAPSRRAQGATRRVTQHRATRRVARRDDETRAKGA